MTLGNFYSGDIDVEELYRDINDGVMLLKSRSDVSVKDPLDLLSFKICNGDDVFPNLITYYCMLRAILHQTEINFILSPCFHESRSTQ